MKHVIEYGARQAELPRNICCRRASPQPAACSVAAHASQLATSSSCMSLASAKPLATPHPDPNAQKSVSLTGLSNACRRLRTWARASASASRKEALERSVSETLLCAFGVSTGVASGLALASDMHEDDVASCEACAATEQAAGCGDARLQQILRGSSA
jgi:hypothetical protein